MMAGHLQPFIGQDWEKGTVAIYHPTNQVLPWVSWCLWGWGHLPLGTGGLVTPVSTRMEEREDSQRVFHPETAPGGHLQELGEGLQSVT